MLRRIAAGALLVLLFVVPACGRRRNRRYISHLTHGTTAAADTQGRPVPQSQPPSAEEPSAVATRALDAAIAGAAARWNTVAPLKAAGRSAEATAHTEEALALWGRALVADPSHVESLFNRGSVLHQCVPMCRHRPLNSKRTAALSL